MLLPDEEVAAVVDCVVPFELELELELDDEELLLPEPVVEEVLLECKEHSFVNWSAVIEYAASCVVYCGSSGFPNT